MLLELTLPDGRKWMQLTDRDTDASAANALSETMIGAMFSAEEAHLAATGGQRTTSFFILLSADETRAEVVARVTRDGRSAMGFMGSTGNIVAGHSNTDPYPQYAHAIQALAEHVGAFLPPEAYPYRSVLPQGVSDLSDGGSPPARWRH